MQQALDAATQIHERAEFGHRDDAPREHRAGYDGFANLGRNGALLFFELLAPRDHDVLAPFLVLDNAEGVDLPLIYCRIGGAGDVDLRHRAEGALPGDAHLVAALDRSLDLTLYGEVVLECLFDFALGGSVAHALLRQCDAVAGGDDDGLDGIANSDFHVAVGIFQFRDVDLGLALAAHADQGHLGTDRNDRAIDGLTPVEALGPDRGFEHRGEVFIFFFVH